MSDLTERRVQERIAASLAADCDKHFERFVVTYQDRIFAFCLGLTKDRGTAQEIAQDTFVRAYQALKKYDPERIRTLSLRAWLYQIALNLTKNSRRRKTFELADLAVLDCVGDGPAGSHAISVSHEILQQEVARTVRSAVERLPAAMRAAVILRHLEDLPYDEIARITGQPEGTIKSNVHRGLALLKKEFAHVQP